jgi:phosphopantetheinyl transferase
MEESCLVGVWKIDESEEQLASLFSPAYLKRHAGVLNCRSKRLRLERLAVRALLQQITGQETDIEYTSLGQPYLPYLPNSIGISHTRGYAAIVLAANRKVAIDAERLRPRILDLAPKFIHTNEYIDPTISVLHTTLHWSAKETMYKVLGIPGIDFRTELLVSRFVPKENKGTFSAKYLKDNKVVRFTIRYFVYESFVITWVVVPKSNG